MQSTKASYIQFLTVLLSIGSWFSVVGQHTNDIKAELDSETNVIKIKQSFTYLNQSNKGLNILYFNDWNHSYSNKKTALAKRFGDEFKRSLHLAKDKNRGFTRIGSIVDGSYSGLDWERTDNIDIIKIELNKTLHPGESINLFFTYEVDLPNSRYTGYGHGYKGGYYLTDWYLSPAMFDGEWHLYPNKDLKDLQTDVANTKVVFTYPKALYLATNYNVDSDIDFSIGKQALLSGTNRKNCEIVLTPVKDFTTHKTPFLSVTTDIETSKYDDISQGLSINKIAQFINENLGQYPHKNLLVSELEYNRNPLYGINQLPSFIRPYREQFQFEMKFLKTALNSIVRETLFLDERKERWVNDAIVNYLLIKYVDQYYPNQKFAGKLSRLWGFRSYNLAKLDFNDQYYLLQMFSVRRNDHQSLSTPNDSLIKFNQKITNRYKAGLGMAFLGEYIGYEVIDTVISDFYKDFKLKPHVYAKDFEKLLKKRSSKEISWFFDEYVASRNNIDFKIRKVTKTEDSITFTIKNKSGTNVPISMFGLQKDSVVSKYWFSDIDTSKTFTIPKSGEDRLVLNYDKKIPEENQRDNWKSLKGFFSSNKKLQFRFLRDVENPYYNQLFYFPEFKFNVNDGFRVGITLNNRTFPSRDFFFSLKPQYSSREKSLVGSAAITKRQFFNEGNLNSISYSLGVGSSFFDVGSRFTTITPLTTFLWRPEGFISNRRQFLLLRLRSVFRNIDPSLVDQIDTEPDFSVLNARFGDIDNNILRFRSWVVDGQLAGNFSKVSFEWEYRTLFENNRQLNLRLYAGKFITNNTDSDFFSFALDRPTDYLFDLNYLNRSQNATGLTSQQFVLAEGGFKSIFDDRFGNDWILTGNLSFNIWQWIEVYGDIGAIRNRGEDARFVYDSGIRLNLVTDFFELYFPVYSNNGYEIAQPNYNEKIRFVVTLSPRTLTGLFTRKWF
nr:metalloprotease [uncultured Allomuricauda sp.]